jgi:hypothetical protein
LGYRFAISRISSASGTGRGRNSTELTMLKITVFVPMQMASVKTMTNEYPRFV